MHTLFCIRPAPPPSRVPSRTRPRDLFLFFCLPPPPPSFRFTSSRLTRILNLSFILLRNLLVQQITVSNASFSLFIRAERPTIHRIIYHGRSENNSKARKSRGKKKSAMRILTQLCRTAVTRSAFTTAFTRQ